ncbi:hypothetical protein PIB30_034406 [Stylosanthes scabra]|uniref:ADP-ribosyl cyclase/cyclic ADP-ribose hydrolase n=1 Tax=Stylosanthes scabra TaxID=79078 RepID=A0ABU6ZCC7_9FABA|nr:hypothetical protein [Stylosanthes scabra]
MKNLVGIESRVEQVISQIGLGLNDVRYIGIWGLGGIGKTTIARAVFETIQNRFEVSCFLADVRHYSGDITRLQNELLKQISPNADYNKFDGSKKIQTSFRNRKVLIVLDDVSHENQLENLANEKDWFGPGSRIIITTRNKEVLKQQEGHGTYEVKELVESEAINLFCSKAFNRPEPIVGFLNLSKEVGNYSGGLPLALKVLGWGKDEVTKILEECGYDAEIGIDILANRSLITLEQRRHEGTVVGMHDLLQEMGKQIVIQESPKDASKRSRSWCYKDIESLLSQKQQLKAWFYGKPWTDTEENWRDLDIRGSCFSKLQLLILDGVTAPILYNIPCTLKVLRWSNCPMETLPLRDQRYELVEIDLSESEIVQLWEGKKFLYKLEHLDLFCCNKLKEVPDLSGAPNLKTLTIRYCVELNYIHPSLTHHKSLVELNLRECNCLETLGDKLEMSSLKQLDLQGCDSLSRVPEFGECMKQLSILNLPLGDIEELPSTFGNLVGLTELYLDVWGYIDHPISLGCFLCLKSLTITAFHQIQIQNIDRLLTSVSLLTSLTSLTLINCFPKSQESIPYCDLAHLAFLTDLYLSYNHFKMVPISIHQLPRLTQLQLNNCSELEVLPDLPSSLRLLQAIGCYSLDASNVNDVISKACCVFAESTSQDGEDVFEMVIPGKEIPAWFEHQEQGNGVSVPFPHNCPSTQTMALSLCFVFDGQSYGMKPSMICCNGKEFINQSLLKVLPDMYSGNMYIVFLNGCYFSNLLGQHNCFHILFPDDTYYKIDIPITRSAARWVCNQDIQDFKKRKATLQLSQQERHQIGTM